MASEHEIAKKLLEVVPEVMRTIRSGMRQLATAELSVPKFRVLAHLYRDRKLTTGLCDLQGVTVPAMSSIVNGLVKRDFVARVHNLEDRRCIELTLTKHGRTTIIALRRGRQTNLAVFLKKVDPAKLNKIRDGLDVLGDIF